MNPNQLWICIDGIKSWLLCNVVGDITQTFTLNPTSWGTDVLSIQPDGSIQHRSQGTNGTYEQFKLFEDFVFVTPDTSKSPNNCSYGFKIVTESN